MTDQVNEAVTNLYHAVNAMLLVVGRDGEIDSRHESTAAVMQALRAIDGGQYNPELQIQAAHPSGGVVDEVIAALDQISGLTRALRNGGPAPEDLQELSDALTEATNVAWCASRALQAAQPAVPSVPEADEVDADAVMAIIDKWMISYDHIGTGSTRLGQISEREWEEDRAKLLELLAATPAYDQPEGEG